MSFKYNGIGYDTLKDFAVLSFINPFVLNAYYRVDDEMGSINAYFKDVESGEVTKAINAMKEYFRVESKETPMFKGCIEVDRETAYGIATGFYYEGLFFRNWGMYCIAAGVDKQTYLDALNKNDIAKSSGECSTEECIDKFWEAKSGALAKPDLGTMLANQLLWYRAVSKREVAEYIATAAKEGRADITIFTAVDGVLSNHEKAKELVKELRAEGFEFYTDEWLASGYSCNTGGKGFWFQSVYYSSIANFSEDYPVYDIQVQNAKVVETHDYIGCIINNPFYKTVMKGVVQEGLVNYARQLVEDQELREAGFTPSVTRRVIASSGKTVRQRLDEYYRAMSHSPIKLDLSGNNRRKTIISKDSPNKDWMDEFKEHLSKYQGRQPSKARDFNEGELIMHDLGLDTEAVRDYMSSQICY